MRAKRITIFRRCALSRPGRMAERTADNRIDAHHKDHEDHQEWLLFVSLVVIDPVLIGRPAEETQINGTATLDRRRCNGNAIGSY